MNTIIVFLIICCVLIPTFSVAFGITAIMLDKKHKIGDQSYVEFSRHHSRTIDHFECSEKAMEKTIADLKRFNGGQQRR